MDRPFEPDFRALFPERLPNFPDNFAERSVRGRRILITGAGGSIGAALAWRVIGAAPERVVLVDHSEQALYDLRNQLGEKCRPQACELILGDIRDESLVAVLLTDEKPDVIFHAAAFKHVPLLEQNPFAAIQNNALATWKLAQLAAKFAVRKLLLISTDKAANPQSMLGVSKRLAELAVLRWENGASRMSALRMGNVAWSSGSVLPLFREQIARGGPVTVTHPEATRYFLSMAETCAAIGALAAFEGASGIFLPEVGEPISIRDLANRMLRLSNRAGAMDIAVQFGGLRPGDKLREDLLSKGEILGTEVAPGIRQIYSEAAPADGLDQQFRKLDELVVTRDLPALLDTLKEIAPEYRPGAALMKLHATAAGGGDD